MKLNRYKQIVFVCVLLLSSMAAVAQTQKINLDFKDTALGTVLESIEKAVGRSFFYDRELIDPQQRISISLRDADLNTAIRELFGGRILFSLTERHIVLRNNPADPISETAQDGPDTASIRPAPSRGGTGDRNVVGVVTNSEGEPMKGVSVWVSDNKRIGTMTDDNGQFQLRVPQSASNLIFSFVGYNTVDGLIPADNRMTIALRNYVKVLDDVVVIGYGTARREDITGAVGVVDMVNMQAQAPTLTLDQMLQGQVSGLYVSGMTGQPGSATRIRIRGTSSLSGSNQPLYVIDGIPVVIESNIPMGGVEGDNLGNALSQEGLSTPIGNINAGDIASITVLKDASAAAIYGSRAANGVIIVTTKSGSVVDRPRFNFNMSLSTQTPRTVDVLNAEQYKQVWVTAVENGAVDNAFTKSILDGSYFGSADTDWRKEIAESNNFSQNYNLSVQGGNQRVNYYTSLGANTQQGLYAATGYDRYSLTMNVRMQVSEKLEMGFNTNTSFSKQMALDGGLTERIYGFRPDLPVRNEDGTYSYSMGMALENPVALSKASNNNKTFMMLSSVYGDLELAKNLIFRSMLSLNYNNGTQESFYPKFTFRGGWARTTGDGDGYAQESRSTFSNIMWENTMSYNFTLGTKHMFNAVLGASFEQVQNSMVKAWGTGFFNNVLSNISSATVSKGGGSLKTNSGLISYFGRVNYNYDNRYLLNVSARIDGSSKFAVDNKYAFFPALSAGWKISEENFMKDVSFVDELKLRASAGLTGQQDFGPYIWRTLYETSDYGNTPSIVISQLGNDRLKWEKTIQYDAGINFSLFDNRLSGEFGFYVKDTRDAIFATIPPGNTGFNTTLANVGDTRNKGLELELSADIVRNSDFGWRVWLNATHNKNTLTRINDDYKDADGYVTGVPGQGGRLKEGMPIGLIWGYVYDSIFDDPADITALNGASPTGVYQNANTSIGDLKFKDISGPDGVPDGVVNTYDQTVVGNAQPKFFGGFGTSFSYKGLTLSAFFTYSVGNDLEWFQQSRSINFASNAVNENKLTNVLDAWTQEKPTNQPRLVYGDPNQNARLSSYYVYDASFVRLKNLHISYTLGDNALRGLRFINVRDLTVYISAQNLLTFTKYPGADPEAANLYNNDISTGRDNNKFPVAKVFTAGLKLNF